MLHRLFRLKKFIPNEYHTDVFKVDYDELKSLGKTFLFCDLDNTLDPYSEELPTEKIHKWKETVSKAGLKIILISNNHKPRVRKYAIELGVPFLAGAKKPLKFGFKKLLRSYKLSPAQVVIMGDQIMTDVLGGNRLGAYTIFIDSIDKTGESWYTRYNRRMEKKVLQKLRKKYPEEYNRIMTIHG